MEPLDLSQCRALLAHAPAMLWRSGTDGGCNYFSAAWLAFTGRSLEQECGNGGNGWIDSVHPENRDACVATYLDHFARRQPFEREYRLRRFDGVYRHVADRGAPYTDPAGRFGGFIGSCVDVDDRRTREAFVGAHELFESAFDNVCVAGFDGYFKQVNPSWTRTLGWTVEELLARPSLEFVHPDDRAALMIGRGRLQSGAHMGPLVNRYRCKDGTYRWFEWRSVADVNRGLVYAVARDITDQKQAEERLDEAKELQHKLERQLIFADRLASVGTLAAGVAHEINNPLSCVAANISLIIEDLSGQATAAGAERLAELREMAIDVQAGAERIRKIVRGLKTFSRTEEERRAVIDVRPLLELSVDMAFNQIRHRARLVKDYGKTPLVDADDARLGQVFINLLVNAAQAIPEGDSDSNEIRIMTSTDDTGRAVIEVRDTGAGIPAILLGRIFDPFFTTKPVGVGTGLGLSICHNTVTAMGGEITVTSEEGRGTTFRVALPAAVAPSDAASAPDGHSKTMSAAAAVLVVDDEPAVGAIFRRVLRDHEVTAVTTSREAIDLLDAGRHFDVIFSDLMMSEMSGMDFYEEVARRFPGVAGRIVFVSGGAFTATANAFLDGVANERIEKPFDHRGLRDLVRRFLEQPARGLPGPG